MKLNPNHPRRRGRSGILLMECLVYFAVFSIVLGGATTVFYYCWDHSTVVVGATDDIAAALHTGERWRADVRVATGKITVETGATAEVLRIPQGTRTVYYRFESGEIRRQTSAAGGSQLLLANARTSQMKMDVRGGISAWRWELELTPHHKEIHLPLRFTFEAAAPSKP